LIGAYANQQKKTAECDEQYNHMPRCKVANQTIQTPPKVAHADQQASPDYFGSFHVSNFQSVIETVY
jgi:hypothetical protein